MLADGAHQAATVSELAAAAGVGQRVAATTLGRLADIRWVRAEKVPELDQRATWYRLQEPMVRHHFHYRSATDQPLPLIVEILRVWYDPTERRYQLAGAEPGSTLERFTAASLGERSTFETAYSDRNIIRLQADARTWIYGGAADTRTAEAGILVDLAITATQLGITESEQTLGSRSYLDEATRAVATDIVERAAAQDPALSVADRAGELLRLAADRTTGRTQLVLELISACWDDPLASAQTRDRLRLASSALAEDDPLRLGLEQHFAYWSGEVGDAESAREQFAALVLKCERVFGAEHLDTLAARGSLAYWTGQSGNAESARDQFAALAPLIESVLGANNPNSVVTRLGVAHWTGHAGEAASARDQFAALVSVSEQVLGAEHWVALVSRSGHAHWVGYAGDAASARDLHAALVSDQIRIFGQDHPETTSSRINLAYWMGEAGDEVGACELAGQLLANCFSPDDDLNDARKRTTAILAKNLTRALAIRPENAQASRDVANLGLVGLLQAAVNGSAEALVRLPSELLPIVESLQARSGDGSVVASPSERGVAKSS